MWLSLPRLEGALSPLPILIACASGGTTANVITAPELSRSRATSAYDAIRQIRPELLRTRDPGALVYFKASQPLVAVDNTLVGGVDVLRAIPVNKVARIEYVNAWKAAKMYGSGFGNGIMLIETRPGSEPELAKR
jgi:outer membrane cobalamin receptor